MTAYIYINGEFIPVTQAVIDWAKREREKKERGRKSFDQFGEYLR